MLSENVDLVIECVIFKGLHVHERFGGLLVGNNNSKSVQYRRILVIIENILLAQ